MISDIEIAKRCKMSPVDDLAKSAGLKKSELDYYGTHIAKVKLSAYEKRRNKKDGKLILVTTTTPTPFGEGKTTMTIGLAQALKKLRKKTMVCMREPSLGPTMGIKGGAAGGGWSQVLPMEDINLHFTGDMHMISSAHNLLAAMTDNHLFFGNELGLDASKVLWNRVMDMNDRALRDMVIKYKDIERGASFDITAASEVMAVLCLAMNIQGLKEKLGKLIVGFSKNGIPVTAADLKADGAMALLLKEALKPNLVQTIEKVPTFVHGGPFANIAHGCNSLIATKLALKLADYVVTEAGFGSDLGAEKFFDIKCREGGLKPDGVVLVITTKALKYQGGAEKDKWKDKNEEALLRGFENVKMHIEGLKNFNVPVVAAINRYEFDDPGELVQLRRKCEELGVQASIADVRESGGQGGIDLAKKVVKAVSGKMSGFTTLYPLDLPLEAKLDIIAKKIYHADGVEFSEEAVENLLKIKQLGYDKLPVCVAKTQFSFSDDAKKTGAPKGFTIHVKRLKIAAGAGFIVAYTGDIMTMPGLPKHPAAENMTIDDAGNIHGIF